MSRQQVVMVVTIFALLAAGLFGMRSAAEPTPSYDWDAILGEPPQTVAAVNAETAAVPISSSEADLGPERGSEAEGPPSPAARAPAGSRRPVDAVGVSTHSLEAEHLEVLRRMGVVNLRRTLRWKLFEEDRAYAVHWDNRLRAALSEGFRVLVVLDEWPANASAGRLAAFLGARVADHPGVEAWQIGNEAAFPGLSGGEAWARIHNTAGEAVKRASPGAKVITMGFSPEQTAEPFARQFLATARRDAVAVHIYRYPASAGIRQLERIDVGSPIWVTEFGLDRNMVPVQLRGDWERVQQMQWKTFIEGALQLGIPRVYGYSLYTDEAGQYGQVESHGLLRPDGSWRPAAVWLQRFLAGG